MGLAASSTSQGQGEFWAESSVSPDWVLTHLGYWTVAGVANREFDRPRAMNLGRDPN